jgi:hypothetical protein
VASSVALLPRHPPVRAMRGTPVPQAVRSGPPPWGPALLSRGKAGACGGMAGDATWRTRPGAPHGRSMAVRGRRGRRTGVEGAYKQARGDALRGGGGRCRRGQCWPSRPARGGQAPGAPRPAPPPPRPSGSWHVGEDKTARLWAAAARWARGEPAAGPWAATAQRTVQARPAHARATGGDGRGAPGGPSAGLGRRPYAGQPRPRRLGLRRRWRRCVCSAGADPGRCLGSPAEWAAPASGHSPRATPALPGGLRVCAQRPQARQRAAGCAH